MKTLKDRVNEELKLKNWTPTKLAKLSGVPQPTVQRIVAGTTATVKRESVVRIAEAFGLTEQELRFGVNSQEMLFDNDNNPVVQIPLLEWHEVSNLSEILFNIKHALNGEEQRVLINTAHHHDGCYCLKVNCEAMKPEFAPGDILVIDPHRIAQSKDFVVVVIKETTTFKQLIIDAGEAFLKSLNADYPTRPLVNTADIVGVVCEKIKRY